MSSYVYVLIVFLNCSSRNTHSFGNKQTEKPSEKHAYLADECTELAGGEAVVDTSEDGNGDDDVAEETSDVVKGVHSD